MYVNEENKELIMDEKDLELALTRLQQGRTITLELIYKEGDPFYDIERITFTNEKRDD